ncbi:MAG TPA: hypothetical protein VKB71_05175 [Rhizomicrobium sp.]|nr:hypothetical protein [Rhizomicrobium sp.]
MTEPRDTTAPLMSLRLGIALVLVSAIAFIGALVLSAFASDFRSEVNGGTNALSQSAVGFAGLYVLLKESGAPVSIDRHGVASHGDGTQVQILTPDFTTSASALQKLALSRPSLIVLPKWATQPDPFHMGWVSKLDVFPPSVASDLLQPLSKSTKIQQEKTAAATRLHAAGDGYFHDVWNRPVTIDSLQTIGGKDWVPDVVDANGHAILAHLPGKDVFVLSDPDFLNTHALKNREAARTALTLINTWRADDPVAFDVTLNGFGTPPSLLRAAFQPPFLGATLCALLASILIGYHAASRFGTPVRPEQVYAFGKTMLVNNSAGLIRMLDRERGMAARYAAAARDVVAKLAGGRRDLPPEALASLEKRARSNRPYTELSAEAQSVRSNAGMLKVARELYQWRVGITHDDRA